MSKQLHLAFRVEYDGIAISLPTRLEVGLPLPQEMHNENRFLSFTGIWDTGATHSVITDKVMKALNLSPVDMVPVSGVNSREIRPVCLVNIVLPNHIILPARRVTVCNLNSTNYDLLIGMDIISLGDFSISNRDGLTHFTFAMPSFQNRTDLLDKANAVNGHKK